MKNKKFYLTLSLGTGFALIGALILEFLGFFPCRLCYYQRYSYFIIFALSSLGLFGISLKPIILILATLFGLGLSIFQVLVERKLINYNSACTGDFSKVESPAEMLKALEEKDLVPCDAVQGYFIGLSLSEWSCIFLLIILFISLFVLYKRL